MILGGALTMTRQLLIAIMFGLGLLGIMACHEDRHRTDYIPVTDCAGPSVQIRMDADTIDMMTGDSARCNGWVIVRGVNGDPYPDVRLSLSLERPFGFIEFVDPAKRDTTDATGRVFFRFLTYNQAGANTVIARLANIQDAWPIYVRQIGPDACSITHLTPERLIVSSTDEDSVHVEIRVMTVDTPRVGIPGYQPIILASGGRLRGLPRTDSTGYTDTYWYSNYQGQGTFGIVVLPNSCYGDTTCVRVDPAQTPE
jgi:hypothetical protein